MNRISAVTCGFAWALWLSGLFLPAVSYENELMTGAECLGMTLYLPFWPMLFWFLPPLALVNLFGFAVTKRVLTGARCTPKHAWQGVSAVVAGIVLPFAAADQLYVGYYCWTLSICLFAIATFVSVWKGCDEEGIADC